MIEQIIYKSQALGQHGKPITIYKFRTMKIGSDKDLEKIISANGINNLGKPNLDPRITFIGKIMRTYFIDELPQIINLLNGDLSLVGIRPKSEVIWSYYPKEHKDYTLKYKPGLFGIRYYYENLETFSDYLEAEKEYLTKKDVDPINTDKEYLKKILFNIIFKNVRSE